MKSARPGCLVLAFPVLAFPVLAGVQGCSCEVSTTRSLTVADSSDSASARALSTRGPERNDAADDAEDQAEDQTDEQAWQSIRAVLGKPRDFRDGVLAFSFARDDLEVTIQGNDTPVAAGLASDFRFYRCPCGLINVIGQFVVADYEANDVLDALREGHIEIASVGPFLLHERPRLMLIRFQGENKRSGKLAQTLRTALSWTGKERMAPQKLDH